MKIKEIIEKMNLFMYRNACATYGSEFRLKIELENEFKLSIFIKVNYKRKNFFDKKE
jgi:hypothetical protein